MLHTANGPWPRQGLAGKHGVSSYPPAHHAAPPRTSDVAARRIAGEAAKQRDLIRDAIATAGAAGLTDAELESATGLRAQSISPRRGELARLGVICDSGKRRPTPRGRPAAVWVVRQYAPPPPTIIEAALAGIDNGQGAGG